LKSFQAALLALLFMEFLLCVTARGAR
jgi:hypothetical protein